MTDIYGALTSCAGMYRSGPEVVDSQKVGDVRVVEVFAMPHEAEIADDLEVVDMHFVKVAVDRSKAEDVRPLITRWCNEHPIMEPGPNYISLGGEIGSQDLALLLMAVGEVLGLWKVIIPERFGLTGEEAHMAAGAGYVMTTGYARV